MFSGMPAGFLKVAVVALVTVGVAVALLATACGGSDDGSAFGQAATTLTATVTPQSTAPVRAPPTATALPPTQPPPTAPPPTDVPPAPTADTRVPFGEIPTADQIQLGKDGKYFIADRGDGCTWVEYQRLADPELGDTVFLNTDCPVNIAYVYMVKTGRVSVLIS